MNTITQPNLFNRGNKLWIRFSINGENIRKPLNLDDTKPNRKLALTQIIPQMILKVSTGEFFENTIVKTIPTVDEYMKVSFELQKGNRCNTTKYGYQKSYDRHIKPIFGNLPLDKITSNQITFWQNNLQEKEKLARATIVRIRTMINTMFEDAIENEIISFNPVTKAKKLKETENSKVKRVKLKPFNTDEIKSVLDGAKNQSRNLLATLFFTGLRAGELIGLKWDCIDLKNKVMSIRRQIVHGEEKEVLKTAKSCRTVPIIDALIPFLLEQYKVTGAQKSFVFLTERTNKHFHNASKIRDQIWIKALKNANVSYRNLHQTRGTFISTLISNGEDINYVSKIAGHENVKVTLERYSEYIPSKNSDFGKCFNIC